MALYLEGLKGPYAGEKFNLQYGFRLGRTQGDIRLENDPKVSGQHANVEADESGNLVLVDADSANGLRVGDKKVPRVTLVPGVVLTIGRTEFKVIESFEFVAPPVPPPRTWREVLIEDLPSLVGTPAQVGQPPEVFRRLVELRFIRGIQMDQKIEIGFGPRQFGADTLDIELHEAISPPIAFTISPSEHGALIRSDYPHLVHVNDQRCREQELFEGDIIRVGQTQIQVHFTS